jgi:hypothetical protein
VSIKVFVTTEVVLAKQVAIVKGLKRKLAAMAKELYRKCRRGDLKSRHVVAIPESAMSMSIYALMRSSKM